MKFRLTLELHLTSFVANLENITQITLVSLLLTIEWTCLAETKDGQTDRPMDEQNNER